MILYYYNIIIQCKTTTCKSAGVGGERWAVGENRKIGRKINFEF